ncbi:MAG: hypothetical protein ACRD22_18265 [Terriglobia bacterium]
MKIYKLLLLTLCAAFGFFACQQTAQASVLNKRTILHVYNPIQIPGVVLSPGTYTIHVLSPNAGQDIVQFKDKSDHQVIATVIAVPDKRMQVTGNTKLHFYEPRPGNPPALRSWFYPGMKYGAEFVYPQTQALGIATASIHYVPAMTDTDMQTFEQKASNNPNSSSNALIYRTSPKGGEVSNSQGEQKNEKLDQNSNAQQQQNKYSGYAKFQNGGRE